MKTTSPLRALVICLPLFLVPLDARSAAAPEFADPVARPWAPKARRAHETVWESTTLRTNPISLHVREVKHSYVQLGTGLNLPQRDGSFIPANPSFTITANGAEAQNTIHKVVLAPDINVEGAVSVTTADGVVLRSNPLGFGYFDPVSGENVILGALKPAIGYLISSNEVVYSNCFIGGIRASMDYRNLNHGFSQNLIVHEQIPPPEAYGLSARSRFELFTQFTADTPLPTQTVRTLSSETNPAVRQTMISPDFTDATLTFSSMRMARGRAFGVDGSPTRPAGRLRAPVGKLFAVIDGKNILLERVEHERIRDAMTNLPPSSAAGITNAAIFDQRTLPICKFTPHSNERIQRMASVSGAVERGREYALVLDYETVDDWQVADHTFKGDTTYLISGCVAFTGTTIVEGGSVLKFDEYSYIDLLDHLDVRTSEYQPVVFTARGDNTIGESIDTGPPQKVLGSVVNLGISDLTGIIAHFRFSFMENPLYCSASVADPVELYHMQFLQCDRAIQSDINLFLGNILIDHCDVGFETYYANITGVHVTMNTADYIHSGNYNALKFTNSLFVTVDAKLGGTGTTLAGAHNGFYNVGSTFPFGYDENDPNAVLDRHAEVPPFDTMGAGSHYLEQRSAAVGYGTGTIKGVPTSLRKDIRGRTTKAPTLLSGNLDGDLVLRPQSLADIAEPLWPNLGYHYPIIDYLVSGVTADLKTVKALDGVVVAFDFREAAYGLRIKGSQFISQGTATKLNRFIRAHAVQEQALPDSIGGNGDFVVEASGSTLSTARFRFSDLSLMSGAGNYFYEVTYLDKWEFLHTQIHGGRFAHTLYNAGKKLGWTNSLFERVDIQLANSASAGLDLFNNTFFGGTLGLASGGSGWIVKDNLFDKVDLTEGANNIQNANNGYVSTTHLSGSGPHTDVNGLTYQNGSLGRFYVDSTTGSSLFNAGSRSAAAAGLYHFTTRTSEQKEGDDTSSTVVDIGFHSVAVDTSSGKPEDNDLDGGSAHADGLADYLEDSNGDGSATGDTTSWLAYKTDGSRSDYQKYLENSMTPKPFVLTWRMNLPSSGFPYGVILRGAPGGNTGNTVPEEFDDYVIRATPDNGTTPGIMFYTVGLDGYYKSKPLGKWRDPNNGERGIRFFGEYGDTTPRQYGVVYDLNTIYVYVDGELQTSHWLDNMAEVLGTLSTHIPRTPILGETANVTIDSKFASDYAVSKTRDQQWDGIVGNTSTQPYGSETHASFQAIKKAVIVGSKMFYTCGFTENKFPIQIVNLSDPQTVVGHLPYKNVAGRVMTIHDPIVADISVKNASAPTGTRTFWVKYTDGYIDQYDANGVWESSPSTGYPDADTASDLAGPGISSKVTNVVAVTRWTNGAAGVPDSRWAVYEANTEQVRVFSSGGTELTSPSLKVGVAPTGTAPNLNKGYDLGPSVQAIPSPAESTATFRTQVKLGGYFHDSDTKTTRATIAFQDDGKLWVSDTATGRMFLFDTAGKLVNWFMYRAHTYVAAVDQTSSSSATRVFSEYLEFEVDHSSSSAFVWKLKNYWGHKYDNGDPVMRGGNQTGLFDVTTVSGPHTLALTFDQFTPGGGGFHVVKLTPNGLKDLGNRDLNGEHARLGKDGALRRYRVPTTGNYPRTGTLEDRVPTFNGGGVQYPVNWSEFGGTGNGSFTYDADDPITDVTDSENYFLLTSDKIIVFNRHPNHLGYHLGALDRTTKQWVWKTALTGPLNGKGQFDSFANFGGWSFNVAGDNDIFLLYRGEFWESDKQANQIFHYKGNGAFVGQFGTPFTQKSTYANAPGMAQNMATVSPYKVGTKMYIYTAEEGGRGVHRWQFDVP